MRDWLEIAERYPLTGCTGPGTMGNYPSRVVLHTTEGPWAAAMGVFERNPCYVPHFLLDPSDGRLRQFIPLSWSSAALANRPGGVETNRAGAIQIEIVGRAAETHTWSDDKLGHVARLLRAIYDAGVRFQWVAPEFVGQEAGFIARVDAPQRFSAAEWNGFNGVCGHQHVPENEHWDPGRLNIQRVFELAGTVEEDWELKPEDKQWFEWWFTQSLPQQMAQQRDAVIQAVNASLLAVGVNIVNLVKQAIAQVPGVRDVDAGEVKRAVEEALAEAAAKTAAALKGEQS